jgi:hypothetical protein
MMIHTINVCHADLVLSEQIMKLTKEAATLSMLAYDETEPDDTVTHDYEGTGGEDFQNAVPNGKKIVCQVFDICWFASPV